MDMTRSKRIVPILSFCALFLLKPAFVAASQDIQQPHQELERFVALSSDHATFDSADFSASELAGTAVSPFCKSFTFLCHVRCLQRGDAKDPTNVSNPSASNDEFAGGGAGYKGEINRCSQVPNTKTNRVLCLCNNGVDLTAEVDYALEGVVDIQAAGGDGVGTGEAGNIREVVYGATKTVTKVVTATELVTTTVTSYAPAPLAATVTVTVVANAIGSEPNARPVPPPSSVGANHQSDENQINKPDDDDNDKSDDSEAGKPDEQDEEDEDALPIHSESVTRKGSHHGFVKVKVPQDAKGKVEPAVNIAQVALDLANSEAQSHFGTAAQELDETGDLAFDPEAYQDPYLEQELEGMVSIDELQAYADEAAVEAEGDPEDKSRNADKDAVAEDEDFNYDDEDEDEEDVDADDEDMDEDEDELDQLNEEEGEEESDGEDEDEDVDAEGVGAEGSDDKWQHDDNTSKKDQSRKQPRAQPQQREFTA
ncbi:hypothetical protein EC991_007562 [Linnemannia zychae]|nr:hypothetical protein EC991_007562 [Linnemannia zychae]